MQSENNTYSEIIKNLQIIKLENPNDEIFEKVNELLKKRINKNSNINNIPIELIENIIQYIDIKELIILKHVSKFFYNIINDYINKIISYYLIINIDVNSKNNYTEQIYMYIDCYKCESKNKKLEKDFYDVMCYSTNKSKKCKMCKYKKISDINTIRYIKRLNIKIIYLNYEKNKIKNIINKNMNQNSIIKLLYNTYEINSTLLNIYTNQQHHNIRLSILPIYPFYEFIEEIIKNSRYKNIIISNGVIKTDSVFKIENTNSIDTYFVNQERYHELVNLFNIYVNIKHLTLVMFSFQVIMFFGNNIKVKKIENLKIYIRYYHPDDEIRNFLKNIKNKFSINKITVISEDKNKYGKSIIDLNNFLI